MAKKKKTEEAELPKESVFINPIDKTKIAENPGLLPYAHTAGGAIIRPEDKGRIKGNAMTAMYEQTDRQMGQLKEQMETLVAQAKSLQRRKEISEIIYQATLNFRPVMGHIYHLYEKKDGSHTVSLIAPEEWGPRPPYIFIATAQLLYDHTWEVMSHAEGFYE
jgi:Protein of unknown function (DUF2452)